MILFFSYYSSHRSLPVSPLTRCFFNSVNSKGPVLGNHLGVQELPKDCHIPFDVSPITKNNKENTPQKNKSIFPTVLFIYINNYKQIINIVLINVNYYSIIANISLSIKLKLLLTCSM